jgi:hypothetical protein
MQNPARAKARMIAALCACAVICLSACEGRAPVESAPAYTLPHAAPTQGEQTTPTAAPQTPAPTAQRTVYVNADGARLRSAPGTGAGIIKTLSRGDALLWIADEGDWRKVRAGNDTGYVLNTLLSDHAVPLATPTAAPNALRSPRIAVYKGARRLKLYDGDALYGDYPIGLGWTPQGHKQREGDGKTPEGSYYVCYRNPNSSYHLSLGVSYPNAADAKQALEDGRIDRATHDRIKSAIDRGQRPPWNTALGGEIMIHGAGAHRDWTAGCIAVENDVMDILYRLCPLGTKIEIYP